MNQILLNIIEQNALENNITNQQSLQEVLIQLRVICEECDLDFDLALDKAELDTDLSFSDCDHSDAVPFAFGSVYCPKCASYIVKGKDEDKSNYVKKNLWRPKG